MRKLSGVFKDEPTTLPTPNVTLAWYSPARLPQLLFKPIFDVPKDLLPSIKIDNLEHQLLCIDHFIDLIDTIYKDDFPISWDNIRYEQPKESIANLLAIQLWTHFKSSN